MTLGISYAIRDASQVADARRAVVALAVQLDFDETTAGRVALLVTEAATNLLKHGGGGELLVASLTSGATSGIEMLALDRGHGIADLVTSLRDGVSTTGSAGTGLGALQRLSTTFDVYTAPETGTAILVRIWNAPVAPRPGAGAVETGAVCVPLAGEAVSGDAWAAARTEHGTELLVIDGLGHGQLAHEAAQEGVRAFRELHTLPAPTRLAAMGEALRHTRGAAAAIADIRPGAAEVRYTAVGNIAGAVLAPGDRHTLVSSHGTLGMQTGALHTDVSGWDTDKVLVLHSDGISSRWDLRAYPGLLRRDPTLIAGILYRDFAKSADDVTVLVARSARGEA